MRSTGQWTAFPLSNKPSPEVIMKRLSLRAVLPVLIGILCIQSLGAEDLGWLQPGVRIWYVGGVSGGAPGSNAQEADLITKFENGSAYVLQQQALANWTLPLPSTEWINPSPYSEGSFWIHPQRLKAMKANDEVSWLGTDRLVKARTSYTASTLPFLKLLPMEELFTLSPTRDMVILSNAKAGDSEGEYYFDVETGLLVSKIESLKDTQTTLSIAEINYTFTNHAAFPEDNGPHAGFAGRFSGGRSEFLNNQGFQLDSMVISRHIGILLMTLAGNLMNVSTNQYYTFNNYLGYDYLQNKASIRSYDVEDWRVNGDHLFWWVPPVHLTNAKIRVWDQDLANRGAVSGVTTFSTADLSQTGFPSLSFDAKGYLTDMTVNVPSMQIYIDTRLASADNMKIDIDPRFATTKNMKIDGLQHYLEKMTPAVPQGKAPTITSQPASLEIVAGQTATLTVTADGNPPPLYGWRKNGTPLSDGGRISGSGKATLTIANSQPSDSGTYSVSVSNTQGSKTSSDAVLNIIFGPTVIHLNKTKLNFCGLGGIWTSSQPVIVSNSGGGTLVWTAASNQSWLTVAPASGTGTGILIVSVNALGLAAGTYPGTITVSDANASNSPQTISVTLTVKAAGSGAVPFGEFATPLDGTIGISGAIPVTGWVLDDIETANVAIWRDPIAGEGSTQIFIGDAIFVEGARPDIETAYPGYPLNYRAGWGYMLLTNFLPAQGNGTYKLNAFATDKEGNQVLLGSKTITCSNATAVKPFGTIDTPAQGGDASGSAYVSFGWVLTPMPKTVPKDGSTIEAYVDSVKVGNLATAPNVYNQYRVDVATAFPGLNNSGGPVGAFYLDTTKYANGVHTIFWIATDDQGAADGIGSRYFNIVNTGTTAEKLSHCGPLGLAIRLEESSRALRGISSTIATPSHREERSDAAIPTKEKGHCEPLGVAIAHLDSILNLPLSFDPLGVKRGFNLAAPPETIIPDNYGSIHIEMKEVERIEIDLEIGNGRLERNNPPTPPLRKGGEATYVRKEREASQLSTIREAGEDVRYSGYQIVGDELRPLPIGATLDPLKGTFSWMPGAGFVGAYDLVFVKDSGSGVTARVPVRITIRPKFGK